MEVYNFRLTSDSLLFHEMCDYMLERGFKSAGLIDILYRPKDNFLWQFDLIFVPATRKEFFDSAY
jgi:hypothetical protein